MMVSARIRVPYAGYGPPPDNKPGWEWKDPVPWVDEYGIWHSGFGEWSRPTTAQERLHDGQVRMQRDIEEQIDPVASLAWRAVTPDGRTEERRVVPLCDWCGSRLDTQWAAEHGTCARCKGPC